MSSNKNTKRIGTYFYIFLIIAGCVLACSTLIPNDYLKLLVVMGSLTIGLYGIMKTLSGTKPDTSGKPDEMDKQQTNQKGIVL